MRAAPGVQAHGVAHDVPQALPALLGHPRRHAHRRDAPRLCDQDVAGAALSPLDGLSGPWQISASCMLYPQVRSSLAASKVALSPRTRTPEPAFETWT